MTENRPRGRLPRSSRIRRRAEYLRIQSEARRVNTVHFALLVHAGPASAPPRLGLVVSKRIGNAVVRNRAKRLIREAFRQLAAEWQVGLELVVIARRPLNELRLGGVVAEWRDAFRMIRRRLREAEKDRGDRESRLANRG